MDSEDDMGRGISRREANGRRPTNGRILEMKVANSVKGVVKVCERFPSVVKGLITLPMNFIERSFSHHLEADDAVNLMFKFVVDNDRGRRRMLR
jgi:hypothetical protein